MTLDEKNLNSQCIYLTWSQSPSSHTNSVLSWRGSSFRLYWMYWALSVTITQSGPGYETYVILEKNRFNSMTIFVYRAPALILFILGWKGSLNYKLPCFLWALPRPKNKKRKELKTRIICSNLKIEYVKLF